MKVKAAAMSDIEKDCLVFLDEMEIRKGVELDRSGDGFLGKTTVTLLKLTKQRTTYWSSWLVANKRWKQANMQVKNTRRECHVIPLASASQPPLKPPLPLSGAPCAVPYGAEKAHKVAGTFVIVWYVVTFSGACRHWLGGPYAGGGFLLLRASFFASNAMP